LRRYLKCKKTLWINRKKFNIFKRNMSSDTEDDGARLLNLRQNIQNFLEEHDIHYHIYQRFTYYSKLEEKEFNTAMSPLPKDSKDQPAVRLIKLLQLKQKEYKIGQLERKGITEGSQDIIQKKMLDVTEIWRKYHIQRPLEISGDVVNWYKDIWENGLCGGWANFHKYEPELLTQIWLLLEKWEPDFGLSTKEALIQFNEYVEKYSYGLVYPKDGWAPLVTSILKNSFKWMKDYENKEYLSEPPELKTPVTYEFKTKRYVKKYKVTVGKKNAGIEIMKLILSDSNVKKK